MVDFNPSGRRASASVSFRVMISRSPGPYAVAFGVVEGDDVGVIVVLQILFVDGENFLVGAEDVGDVAAFLVIEGCDGAYPFVGVSFAESREFYLFGVIADGHSIGYCVKVYKGNVLCRQKAVLFRKNGALRRGLTTPACHFQWKKMYDTVMAAMMPARSASRP